MAANDVEAMIGLIRECTDMLQPEDWPLHELDEMCLQTVPDGTQVQAICTSYYGLEVLGTSESEGSYGVRPIVGNTAIDGYFRGLQAITHIDTSIPGTEIEITELTLRFDTLTDAVHLVPVASLVGFEMDETDPVDVLDYEDILRDIDVLICNDIIDLAGLSQLFNELDAGDIRVALYLKHLNNMLQLTDMLSAVLARQYINLSTEEAIREIAKDAILIEIESGKSFCIIQATLDTGDVETILCVNGLKDSTVPVKVPVNSIESTLGR